MKNSKYLFSIIIIFLLFSSFALYANEKKFTLVIDAGHGGHDAGARGKYSKEKDINLSVGLKLGDKIKKEFSDVNVIYTRDKDVFIELQERANIANRNHADLFISIHTNSARSSSAYGTETWVLGLARTKENLEVAMKENSVITLEDDYKTKYEGFDPNSVDSYIMFNFMQDRYLDKSLEFASLIETEFKGTGRYSRGVKQSGFLVLRKPACASVLIELGFISNRSEEKFLNTNIGQSSMVNAIFNAFKAYKKEYDRKNAINEINETNETNKITETPKFKTENKNAIKQDKITYKIQLFALERRISPTHNEFKGLENVDYYLENGFYKYTYGEASSFKEIEKIRKQISSKFPKAYIIAFKGENKITIGEAMKQE